MFAILSLHFSLAFLLRALAHFPLFFLIVAGKCRSWRERGAASFSLVPRFAVRWCVERAPPSRFDGVLRDGVGSRFIAGWLLPLLPQHGAKLLALYSARRSSRFGVG